MTETTVPERCPRCGYVGAHTCATVEGVFRALPDAPARITVEPITEPCPIGEFHQPHRWALDSYGVVLWCPGGGKVDPGPVPVEPVEPASAVEVNLRAVLRAIHADRDLDWATEQMPAVALVAVVRAAVDLMTPDDRPEAPRWEVKP